VFFFVLANSTEHPMNHRHLLPAIAIAAGIAATASAQTGQVMETSKPGAVGVAQTYEVSATIVAIDAPSRAVTLKGPEGREMTVIAGPEVQNFDRLRAGDKVKLKYVEALTVELKKGGGLPVARTVESGKASAAKGETPGAAAGTRVTIVGDVIDTDPSKQMVTVRGPQRTIDLKVGDPEQFKLIKKGDQLQATYVEAVAVSVTPQ
jgi:hypothetical protein